MAVSIAAAVAEARVVAEAALTDTVTITRETVDVVDDLDTEGTTETPVWSGPALVQRDSTRQLVALAGEKPVDASAYVVKLAVTVPVKVGDVVTVDESLDPMHLDRRWRILEVPTQAWSVLHRCPADPMPAKP